MISKIEILKDEPASYNWKAERINPIWEYEWEKRSVVEVRPPEEPEEDNPLDFEDELKLDDYIMIPMYKHFRVTEANTSYPKFDTYYEYYMYRNNGYIVGITKPIEQLDTWVSDFDRYYYPGHIKYDIPNRLKIIYNLTDEEISNIPNVFDPSGWEYIETVADVPVHYSLSLMAYPWDRDRTDSEYPRRKDYEFNPNEVGSYRYDVWTTGGCPNTPYSNPTYYPELLYISDKNIIKRLLNIWLNDTWMLNPNNVTSTAEMWWGDQYDPHRYYYYLRVCQFPCYITERWHKSRGNKGIFFDINGTIKYRVPERFYTTNNIPVIFTDEFWDTPLEKQYENSDSTYWTWEGNPMAGSYPFMFFNYNYYFGNVQPEPGPEPTPEITYEKGPLIEKLYSQNENAYPLDDMDENHQYWYTRTSQKIISYMFSKQYSTITNVNKDAFPQKGVKYYNGQYYWFTYIGTNRKVLTTFDTNVLLDNIDYVQSTGNNNLFTIGNVAGASIQFDVWKPLKDVLPYAGMECRYYQKRKTSDAYILEGIFNIQEIHENGLNKTTVIAYDNSRKLNMDARALVEQLYYPTSLYQLFIIMCSYCNIPYDLEIYFPHMNEVIWDEIQFENENEEISCRNMLEWIAQIAGGIFVVDYDGSIVFRDLHTPNKINGSYEATNYSLSISKLPILKPSKVVYDTISVSKGSTKPYDNINVIDLTKNPILAIWNEDIIRDILNDILSSISQIPDIYPMECHIGDDKAIRQCGDYWIVETNRETYLSIITEKHINSSGITLSCSGDIVPYLEDYELTPSEISEIVETYRDTFFRFYYNSIVLKDVSNYTLITLNKSGYVDENNLILDLSNIQFTDGGSTVTKNYMIDFSSCINELLAQDGVHIRLGNGVFVSFIDNVLYIQDTRYWRKDITETTFYYKINDSAVVHTWNHNNNNNTFINETMFYLSIMSCHTYDVGVNETKQFMYEIAMLMKNYNQSEIMASKIGDYYSTTQWRFNFGDGQNITLSTRNKFPSIFYINGLKLKYDANNNRITLNVLAAVKETDSEHTGDYITVSFVETEYYQISTSTVGTRFSGMRLHLVNALGEPVTRLYNGEYAYVFLQENDALVVSYNEGFYNYLGLRITSRGNDVQFYAEKRTDENNISINLFEQISRSSQLVDTHREPYYTLYKVWSTGDGVYVYPKEAKYYSTICPIMQTSQHVIIEYIDANNESYFYIVNGFNDINGRLKSAYFDRYNLDENTRVHSYLIQDTRLNLQVACVEHTDVDIYSTDRKRFEIFTSDSNYDVRRINYSTYHQQTTKEGYPTIGDFYYYDLYRADGGSEVKKVYIVGGSRDEAVRLMTMTHREYWNHLTEIPKQGYWVVKNLFSNGDDIRLQSLCTWDYIQIRPKDTEGSL